MMSRLVELFKEKSSVISADLIEKGTISIYELRTICFYCETYKIITTAEPSTVVDVLGIRSQFFH